MQVVRSGNVYDVDFGIVRQGLVGGVPIRRVEEIAKGVGGFLAARTHGHELGVRKYGQSFGQRLRDAPTSQYAPTYFFGHADKG